jgi:hypothetical protein
MKYNLILIWIFVSGCLNHNALFAQTDEEKILATVQAVFDNLKNPDSTILKVLYAEKAYSYAWSEFEGEYHLIPYPSAVHLVDPENSVEEIMRKSGVDVKIHKNLAVAWVPYDFYANGAFHHCGINVFNLIKEDERWKITSILYSMEKTGCEDW